MVKTSKKDIGKSEQSESQRARPKIHNRNNYAYVHEGEIDPNTGKEVKVLIMSDPNFVVFLDPKNKLEWSSTGDYEEETGGGFSPLYGETLNVIARLDAMSEIVDLPAVQIKEFRMLLGMALVAMLNKEKPHVIREALRNAEVYLLDRMKEKARLWYLSAAFITAAIALVLTGFLGGFYNILSQHIGVNTLEVAMATGAGSIGALISIIFRSNKLAVNLESGKTIYHTEGAIRVVVGIFGALLIALMIKGNLVLGTINTLGNAFAVMLAVCIAAGASEQITPSLIKKVESIVAADDQVQESSNVSGKVK
jgi:hypothetical protein